MTDAPRFAPHPDDPQPGQVQGGQAPASNSAPQPLGGYQQPHQHVAEPYTWQPSDEQNVLGVMALAVSGVAFLLMVVQFVNGGIPLLVPLAGGIFGTVLGVRGLNAVRRDRATNRGMALAGTILGTVTIIAVPLYFLFAALFVIALIEGVTEGFLDAISG